MFKALKFTLSRSEAAALTVTLQYINTIRFCHCYLNRNIGQPTLTSPNLVATVVSSKCVMGVWDGTLCTCLGDNTIHPKILATAFRDGRLRRLSLNL